MTRTTITIATTAAALLALAGCSTDTETAAPTPPETSTTVAADTTTPATTVPATEPDLYEVTPAGLTTAVNAPITISAAEMTQACNEIQAFATSLGMTDVETVLALTQATAEDSTEGFTVTEGEGQDWADSSPGEQAGLIAAVNAAISGEC